MDPIKQVLDDASKYIREDTGKIKKQFFFHADHIVKTDIVFKVIIHFLKENKLSDVDQSALRNLNSALDERIKVLETPPLLSRILLSLFQWTTNSKVQRQIGEVRSLNEWVKPEQKRALPLSIKATTVSRMAIPDLGMMQKAMSSDEGEKEGLLRRRERSETSEKIRMEDVPMAPPMEMEIPFAPPMAPMAPPMAPGGPALNVKISKPSLFDADFLFQDEPTPPRKLDINKADKSFRNKEKGIIWLQNGLGKSLDSAKIRDEALPRYHLRIGGYTPKTHDL